MLDQTSSVSGRGLEAIRQSLDDCGTTAEFRPSVKDHYTHLLRLSEGLKRLGMDEATIDEHVIGIFEQYRAQLLRSVTEFLHRSPA